MSEPKVPINTDALHGTDEDRRGTWVGRAVSQTGGGGGAGAGFGVHRDHRGEIGRGLVSCWWPALGRVGDRKSYTAE